MQGLAHSPNPCLKEIRSQFVPAMNPDDAHADTTPRPQTGTSGSLGTTVLKLQSPAPKPNLIGLSRAELAAHLHAIGTPADRIQLRVKQLWRWIYVRGCRDFLQMEDIVGAYRRRLDASFSLIMPSLVSRQASVEGTRKYLFRVGGGHEIETVYIPEAGRGTVCVSSQVGCTLNCSFCHSGTQALVRNLNAAEIVGQLMAVRDDFKEWHSTPGMPKLEERLVSNVVFMGMGEPLANYTNVSESIQRLTDPEGFALSPRRITVSTVGIPQNIRRLASDHPNVNLAVSLHAPDPKLRSELVPVPGASIDDILDAVREHNRSTGGRVTFEYVLLRDVNDSRGHARRLADRIRGLRAHVNLIPLNPSPGVVGERPTRRATLGFQQALQERGVPATVRVEQGRDIAAACGQLRGDRVRDRK